MLFLLGTRWSISSMKPGTLGRIRVLRPCLKSPRNCDSETIDRARMGFLKNRLCETDRQVCYELDSRRTFRAFGPDPLPRDPRIKLTDRGHDLIEKTI
jgi:hypothetical protein